MVAQKTRLTGTDALPDSIAIPGYTPADHGIGIVHLGPGAFFKSHLAYYTDAALAVAGGDWRIAGVALRSKTGAEEINPQNGLYTLLEKDISGTSARVIGSVSHLLTAPDAAGDVMRLLTSGKTKIVSLTITEKGYGIDRQTGGVDIRDDGIAADLLTPKAPRTAIGLIVEALALRRQQGVAPFTVLCCDNLPENGRMLRDAVIDFAYRTDLSLGDWIAENVAFPSTMVDRITPARTDSTLQEAETALGCADHAAIEAETFHQWVIEDSFPTGRPNWEAAGAIMVEDVKAYESMKLRMLNGTHSLLAYSGFLAGFPCIRDTMTSPDLVKLSERFLRAAAATLDDLPGIDLQSYAGQIIDRFANPAIAHETYQIAMDGTEKLPQRIFEPAIMTLENGGDIRPFAFATAAWMRYCMGRREDGQTYALRDPREDEITRSIAGVSTPKALMDHLMGLEGLFPAKLRESDLWVQNVLRCLENIFDRGIIHAVQQENTRA